MVQTQSDKTGLDFICDFYRGSSGYADFIDYGFLLRFHVVTELDSAVIEAVTPILQRMK